MDPYQSVEVVNRRNVRVERMFDGIVVIFEPHEKKHYPPNIAQALCAGSELRLDLASGVVTAYALGITGDGAFPTTPLGDALADRDGLELLDRSNVPKLTETEPKSFDQTGAHDMGVGKVDKVIPAVPGSEGDGPQNVVQPAAATEVTAKTFVNDAVRRGSQRPGRAEHRISHKPVE